MYPQKKNIIRGVSFSKNDSKITLVGVKDRPGIAAAISVKLNKDLLDLDPVLIQKELKKQGARYW